MRVCPCIQGCNDKVVLACKQGVNLVYWSFAALTQDSTTGKATFTYSGTPPTLRAKMSVSLCYHIHALLLYD